MSRPWKTLLLLLGLLFAAAASGRGQPASSSEGLYSPADGKQVEEAKTGATSERIAQSYLQSLDPEVAKLEGRPQDASPAKQHAADSGLRLSALSDNAVATWSPWAFNVAERTVVAIVAAVGGIASLIAVAYVWRARAAQDHSAPTLLRVARPEASDASRENTEEETPATQRRAA